MRRGALILLDAFVAIPEVLLHDFFAHAQSSDLWTNRINDAHNPAVKVAKDSESTRSIDEFIRPLLERSHHASTLHYADLDDTTFAKATDPMVFRQPLAFPRSSFVYPSPSFAPRPYPLRNSYEHHALGDSEAFTSNYPDGLPSRTMELEYYRQQEEAGVGMFGAEDITLKEGGAFLVAVNIKWNRYKTLKGDETRNAQWTVKDSLDELARLCDTAKLDVRGREVQSLDHPVASTYIGSGKVLEVKDAVRQLGVQTVVFDEELSPAQQKNLQGALEVQVIDRTMLILQIFGQRARTREAKLQVQLAQMQYMLPRLKSFMTTGAGMEVRGGGASSGGGAQFLKGAGESQLEMDRRLFRKRISKVEDDLEQVRATRELHREKRKRRGGMPLVALVGYTNAGKSSMLNSLCGKAECKAEVYADDMLFATLDPTMRQLRLPGGREVMLADTVGFIQKLPTKLVPAFRATLEVCQDADIILHVVDASSPIGRQQAWSVNEILSDEGVNETPQVLALNKADIFMDETGELPDPLEWMSINEHITPAEAIAISVTRGDNIPKLLESIEKLLVSLSVKVECVIPYSASELFAEIRRSGTIESEEYTETGIKIVAFTPQSLAQRLKKVALPLNDAVSSNAR